MNRGLSNAKTVFLAGTIDMGSSEDWQSRVAEQLRMRGFVVFNPRRDDWDSSWKQEMSDPAFYQQVTWELNALSKADYIIMYLAPESKSPISLLELGLYARSGKLLICCPKEYWRSGNVDVICHKYGIRQFDSLDQIALYLSTKI